MFTHNRLLTIFEIIIHKSTHPQGTLLSRTLSSTESQASYLTDVSLILSFACQEHLSLDEVKIKSKFWFVFLVERTLVERDSASWELKRPRSFALVKLSRAVISSNTLSTKSLNRLKTSLSALSIDKCLNFAFSCVLRAFKAFKSVHYIRI